MNAAQAIAKQITEILSMAPSPRNYLDVSGECAPHVGGCYDPTSRRPAPAFFCLAARR
jgi:hypothetical protein